MTTKQRVIVTGGTGYLGHFVVEALYRDHAVTVVDRVQPSGDKAHPGVTYVEADVLDLPRLPELFSEADAVIHLAAIDAGNPFPDETYFRTNVQGTWNVLHTAQSTGVQQVVIASSSSVYGIDAARAPQYLPIDESHPQTPSEVYGLTKALIEVTAASFARRGQLRVTCLRPAHIVRPQTEAPIVLQLALDDADADIAEALQARGVEAYGELPALRGYVRSRDAAQAFRLALDYDASAFAAFNVMADDSMGRTATLHHLERVYGTLPALREGDAFARTPRRSVFSSKAGADALGWQAAGGFEALVAEHGL